MGYIYKITNLINGKMYIGQTKRSIEIRWKEHLRSKDDSPIHKAFRKYGIENFKIEILEECTDDLLNEKEIYYIKQYNSYNGHIGYNATPGGENSAQGAINWVKSHPEEVRNNLNKAREIAIKKFEDNPELKEKREKLRMEGYKKYIEENREEWLISQREKLKKARQALQDQYKENPEKIINRAKENGKKASKAVKQIDKKTGEVIQVFESCSAAAKYLGHEGGHTNISKACRKPSCSAFGFKWAYV